MKTNSSKHNWGGDWTEKKLTAFAKYVNAYLSIMNQKNFWQTIYFDGFAGSGTRENEEIQKDSLFYSLFEDENSIKENMLYRGSAERVVSLDKKFNHYYFVDTNKSSLDSLKNKLSNYTKNLSVEFRNDNANNQLCQLANAMHANPKKYAALVFLDPFAMEVSWECIQKLKDTRTDLWILVPTGTIINRLLGKNGELIAPAKLVNFFGVDEEYIKNTFYQKQQRTTLFGEDETIKKIPDPITRIADLYNERLKTIWKYTTNNPLPLYNSKNVPIFHLIFASNNAIAVKIASQIISSV